MRSRPPAFATVGAVPDAPPCVRTSMMVPGGFFRNDIPGGSGSAGDFSGIVELRVVVASGCFFVGATPEDEWSVRFSETVGIFFAGTWMADTGPAGAVTVTVFTVTDSTVPPDVAT